MQTFCYQDAKKKLKNYRSKHMGKYHVFLSCEDDINIGDDCIEKFLSKKLPKDIAIESIKKHDNIIWQKKIWTISKTAASM